MKIVAQNKKAYHNYFIDDKVESGLELLGWEVKSARANNLSLDESFVFFKDGEAFLKNAYFAPYENARLQDMDLRRDRRLLMRSAQIDKIHKAVATKGVTCVVTKLYFSGKGLLKAEVATARGKQLHDKRQTMKERDIKRETDREIKTRGRDN